MSQHSPESNNLDDEELLIRADSLLSLIRYREGMKLSERSRLEIDDLIRSLRPRTEQIIKKRSNGV